jgi:hypothetical protein
MQTNMEQNLNKLIQIQEIDSTIKMWSQFFGKINSINICLDIKVNPHKIVTDHVKNTLNDLNEMNNVLIFSDSIFTTYDDIIFEDLEKYRNQFEQLFTVWRSQRLDYFKRIFPENEIVQNHEQIDNFFLQLLKDQILFNN